MSMQEQMLWEKVNNVAQLNGDNNSDFLKKDKKETWQYTYNSTARNVIRMWWLTDFIGCMFVKLTTTKESLYDILCASYTQAFADHHPWLIRTGAGVCMYAAGTREEFMLAMSVKNISQVVNIGKFCVGLKDALTKFYKANGMADLP